MANLLTPTPPAARAAPGPVCAHSLVLEVCAGPAASRAGLEHIGRRPPGRTGLHPEVTEGTQFQPSSEASYFS